MGPAAPLLDVFLATGPHLSMALQMNVHRSVSGQRLLTDEMETSRNRAVKPRSAIHGHLRNGTAARLGTIRMSTTRWPAVLVLTRHKLMRARPNTPSPNLARLRADKSRRVMR